MASKAKSRLSFQEMMHLVKLPPVPDSGSGSGSESGPPPPHRYMSTRAAYIPGAFDFGVADDVPRVHNAAFGGHVYAQAGLAACRAWSEIEDGKGVNKSEKLGLHTIHGYFTAIGLSDRPFIYTPDHFPIASLTNLNPPCFTALVSFKLAEPHSAGISIQEPSPFSPSRPELSSILSGRPPHAWPPAPPVDIDGMVSLMGTDVVGNFPCVDMKKVDMTGYNAPPKPVHERRELLLYRLLKPLPPSSSDDACWDANAHILVHAFAADRNGLLMAGNHLGLGWTMGKAASLSYSFVVHVNANEAVMECDESKGEWWVQEASFPRAAAGRGIVESKIWSPQGVHVATEYQDGLIRSFEDRPEKGKLMGRL
ncbi:thioesterase-like superfamily-domain-containing protein [Bombardia bombarda]|uniref:Thioesterase-like superfamily-domain-containing protein n=1 Tax=Bombardia bombarda TaxID=252184 RepID=A0AA39W9N4_9PEZI|nr:thioesterase-like superfamily-domain-containing protein [Bombardia bombarda]